LTREGGAARLALDEASARKAIRDVHALSAEIETEAQETDAIRAEISDR
jgi:hypothetical protein